MSTVRSGPATAGMAPGEAMFVVALAVTALVAGVVWLGAALAAAAIGATPPGGLADALRAIPRLAEHRGDPAAAWPPPPGAIVAVLPGPVLYWSATVVAAAVAAAGVAAARVVWRKLTPGRQSLGVDVHARFATRRELRPLLVRQPVPGRLVLGRWGRWLVATESQRWDPVPTKGWAGVAAWITGRRRRGRSGDVTSVAIVGPTRSGKTAECAIPAVLDWHGPAILLSVKRDLMDTTIAQRRTLGQVRVFDPGGLAARNVNPAVTIDVEELARWSPLRNAHTATGAKKAGAALSAWTPKAGVEGGMSFWETQGKLLFSGLLGAAALSDRRSMADVSEWVFNMTRPGTKTGCPPMRILRAAIADPATHEAARAATMHLASIWNKDAPTVLSSVYSTATSVCDPWLDPNVIAATDLTGSDAQWVDLDWLMDTGRDGKDANTLYLLVSNADYERLAPVLAGLLSDLKADAYEWESVGRKFPAPLLMLIDEAGNMPLSWLPEVSSTCAGIGMQLVTIWQSLAQIKAAYGAKADILLTNHATKLFFPASSDETTLAYQSKIVGDEDVERRSWSSDIAGGNGRRSVSTQESHDPLVPYFLARLTNLGQALMIHSNTPPAQLNGRRWWHDRHLAAMVPTAVAHRHHPPRGDGTGPWQPTPSRTDNPSAPAPPPSTRRRPEPRSRRARRPPPGVDPTTGEITTRPADDVDEEMPDAS